MAYIRANDVDIQPLENNFLRELSATARQVEWLLGPGFRNPFPRANAGPSRSTPLG